MSEDPNQPFIFNYDKPEEPTPPPIQAPPVQDPPPPPPSGSSTASKAKKLGPFAAGAAYLLAKLKTFFSFLWPLLKVAKMGKILLTMGTMLLSIWAYAQIFGLWFAVGFVVLIFVHEMGHVWAAYKMGIPVSAPIFIPFMGALILTKKFGNKKITEDAIIGIGGPALGTLGALVCAAIYMLTGSQFFLGLATVGFLLNLFNLTPVFPLDGGWIVRAISPILWLIGIGILTYMTLTGHVRNPMIFILVILGLPTMWQELTNWIKKVPSTVPTDFRWVMGACYVILVCVCTIGMSLCYSERSKYEFQHSRGMGPAVSELPVGPHRKA